jgi:hypothetical protein
VALRHSRHNKQFHSLDRGMSLPKIPPKAQIQKVESGATHVVLPGSDWELHRPGILISLMERSLYVGLGISAFFGVSETRGMGAADGDAKRQIIMEDCKNIFIVIAKVWPDKNGRDNWSLPDRGSRPGCRLRSWYKAASNPPDWLKLPPRSSGRSRRRG